MSCMDRGLQKNGSSVLSCLARKSTAAFIVKKVVILAVALAMLATLFTGCVTVSNSPAPASNAVSGPWHNATDQRVLRFQDDGTVIFHNASGDVQATYIFDSKTGQGMISFNGAALPIKLSGDNLILTEKGDSTYVRGDMDIQVAAVTPAPTPSQAPSPSVASTTSAPSPTPSPHTPTPAPVSPAPPVISSLPRVSGLIIPSGLFPVTPAPPVAAVGTWVSQSDSRVSIIINADSTYTAYFKTSVTASGSYTFNTLTNQGVLHNYSAGTNMSYIVSGNTMKLNDGTKFDRH